MTKKKKVTVPKQKKITLTIRATKADEIAALTKLKSITQEKTFAGAVMTAAKHYPNSLNEVIKLKEVSLKLRDQLSTMADIIMGYLDSQNNIIALSKSLKQVHRPYKVGNE